MAHQIRTHKDFVNELNMVAEIEGKIVGSIMYTSGKLICEDGTIKSFRTKRKNLRCQEEFYIYSHSCIRG